MKCIALTLLLITSATTSVASAAPLESYLQWKNARGESAAVGQASMISLDTGMVAALDYIRAPDGSLITECIQICAPKNVRSSPSIIAAGLEMQFETFEETGGFT